VDNCWKWFRLLGYTSATSSGILSITIGGFSK
jgi:hypothetical protein